MLNNFLLLCRALRAGESLADPATWKQRQLRLNALLAILWLLAKLLPVELAPDDIDALANGIGMIGGTLVNGYLTVATTVKIGFGRLRGES
jgi:hypothetical protein